MVKKTNIKAIKTPTANARKNSTVEGVEPMVVFCDPKSLAVDVGIEEYVLCDIVSVACSNDEDVGIVVDIDNARFWFRCNEKK